MNAGLSLAILFVAIAALAVVNSIEIAVVAANRVRVHHLATGGSRRAQALERLHRKQERFFAAIVLVQNLCAVIAGAVSTFVFESVTGESVLLRLLIGGAVATALTALLGELTPKVLAAHAREGYALFVALPAEALTRVMAPVVTVLAFLPNLLSRAIFGIRLDASLTVTEAELRMLIGQSAESGSVEEAEAELLNRVFHFGDRRVHEVMVPRTEVVWLEHGARVRDFYKVFQEHPHSRFPVFEGNQDAILGIVGIKDVMRGLSTGQMNDTSPVESVMRPAYFVPETKLVGELFREMQANRSQMAVAVDEFGGTAGIVTLEQLLEEMVGSVGDELHPPETEIQPIDEATVQVDGTLSIAEAREELGIDIPEGEYDTIAGYVLSILGRIPQEGESVPLAGHRVTIVEMKGPKIELLRVTRA